MAKKKADAIAATIAEETPAVEEVVETSEEVAPEAPIAEVTEEVAE